MADPGTMFVRGTGGVVWQIDVPRPGSNAEDLLRQKLDNGDLAVVDCARQVEIDGAVVFVADVASGTEQGKARRRKAPAAETETPDDDSVVGDFATEA